MRRSTLFALALALGRLPFALAGEVATEYEVGGPLAGIRLPPFPTQWGEPPGYPGRLRDAEGNFLDAAEPVAPLMQLHPESVEHFRSEVSEYAPARPFFDRQSLIKNFPAITVPGVHIEQVESYAEPVYWVPRGGTPIPTGKFHRPVPVVRAKVALPVFHLDLGDLAPGLYALRVIGAVETKSLETDRRPLYLRANITDRPDGGFSTYRLRTGYVDEFYAVAEIYFHAPVQGTYRADILVDHGSLVELLIHNFELHDVLAGTTRRAVKRAATLTRDAERAAPGTATGAHQRSPLSGEEREWRDWRLWHSFPPTNTQPAGFFTGPATHVTVAPPRLGAAGRSREDIAREWGVWEEAAGELSDCGFLVNPTLGLEYTLADLNANRPLPPPYPFRDDGAGLYFAAEAAGMRPQNWFPIAEGVQRRLHRYLEDIDTRVEAYAREGDGEAGRDAALMLCRLAYDFPTLDPANTLAAAIMQPGATGRDWRCRQRLLDAHFLPGGAAGYLRLLEWYDRLFNLIKNNEGLAQSVQRFVPWVQSAEDVVQLLDVYLVQILAKRIMRYHYCAHPAGLALCAATLGDRTVTDAWMQWLFTRAFWPPLPPSGLHDLLVTGTDRQGVQYTGSFLQALARDVCTQAAVPIEKYLAAGGSTAYDLRDPKRYPKALASAYFPLRACTAGLWHLPIGTGTDQILGYGSWLDESSRSRIQSGWRWTRNPAFAYMLRHYYGRRDESDAEWAEIEAAAARQPRAPWLLNRSRVLPNWAGILEGGGEHDDFRCRRAVIVRVGQGWGGHHCDALDLQIFTHGVPMTGEMGTAPGDSQPPALATRLHNLVEVDGQDWLGHSWVRDLADIPSARYLSAEGVPPNSHRGVRLYRRQVALIDVDGGRAPVQPLSPAELLPQARLKPGVVYPAAYVIDVFRVAGGALHTYCFRGPVSDDVRLESGTLNPAPDDPYLVTFPRHDRKWVGLASENLRATWQVALAQGRLGIGEKRWLGPSYYPDAPRKYTRLHLPGQRGARVLLADAYSPPLDFALTNLFVQRAGSVPLESVFAAVIEPYAGEPFIRSVRLEQVANNETDALRAVALEVTTAQGRRDFCFADGRPELIRSVGAASIAGEFIYYSNDAHGLRQAVLIGGTLLHTREVTLALADRQRSAKIAKVNYAERTVELDAPWPAAGMAGRVVEVGLPGRQQGQGGHHGHWTTYTIEEVVVPRPPASPTGEARVEATGEDAPSPATKAQMPSGKTLRLRGGADFYLAAVTEVEPEKGLVHCRLGLPHQDGAPVPGLDTLWVASNRSQTRFWRAEYLGGNRADGRYTFRLTGGPVSLADFGESRSLRLWEYGVGDTVRQNTFASLRRLEPAAPGAPEIYELVADVNLTLALPGRVIELSRDRANWWQPQATPVENKLRVAIDIGDLTPEGRLFVRVQ